MNSSNSHIRKCHSKCSIATVPDDTRDYVAAGDILNHFQIGSVMLMINNSRKSENLEKLRIKVSGRIHVPPVYEKIKMYMETKIRSDYSN